ncbi:MAG: hypothetical protein L3J69_00485 [Desulfobacula sp.]|nr:hypothetical protein [Desulfobacula sp.]
MIISNSNNARSILSLTFLIIGLSIFFIFDPVFAQSETKIDKTIPTYVVSDKMVAKKNTSMVEFIGNVKVTRDDSIMLADSIKIFFNENNNTNNKKDDSPQNNVKKIVSIGNIRYTAGEHKAFADRAVYTTADGILVLTGKSPKLVTGSSFVTGKKITLFRKQDKVIVESDGTQRVEALFNPEDTPEDKQ